MARSGIGKASGWICSRIHGGSRGNLGTMDTVSIVWFKRDLRIYDHAPLVHAAAAGRVLPLLIVEPELWQQDDASGRQYAFFRESAEELAAALAERGAPLVIRVGEASEVLGTLIRELPVQAVHSHQETGNAWTYARDRRVAARLRELGVRWHQHRQFGVIRGLRERQHWVQQWQQLMAEPLLPAPAILRAVAARSEPLPDWLALRGTPDPCPARQVGGRRAGSALLDSFLSGRGREYHRRMSSPLSAAAACSRLSPHLAWGTLSLREVVQLTRARKAALSTEQGPEASSFRRALTAYLSRLHWHCHFIQKLESEPEIEYRNVHRGYDGMREADFDRDRLQRWCAGETGWPFVDACLRMLAQTGWINFRMRAMLVAVSSYHLWLHWREPGLHLARQFTDYEPGIHWSQVQMQSGVTGINIPRMYNPLKQSIDQDPEGQFIRRWLPQLASLPTAWLHAPWRADAATLRRYGVVLDRHYPRPLVDHEQAARLAKQRLTAWRRRPGMREGNTEVLRKHGSRKRPRQRPIPRPQPQGDLFRTDP
jgi:deoxyribodipyrimidine photo-lyase